MGTVPLVSLGEPAGVSLAISINYLGSAATGETIEIDARIAKVGRRIGTVQVC